MLNDTPGVDNPGAFDHSTRSGWTGTGAIPFNGAMSTNDIPGPAPIPPFGALPSPFGGAPAAFPSLTGCRCHAAVGHGRDLVNVNATRVGIAADNMVSARAAADAIDWQGAAATLFRQKLARCVADGERLRDEASATLRMAWIGDE